jgi:serine/threonine-protein kinase
MTTTRAAQKPAVPSAIPQAGEMVADKYQVDGILGSGGMGVVLAARHVGLGQAVAIKVLTLPAEHEREGATERFLREGRATASLDSEHVVRVHDVGTLPTGAPYLVMELLRGMDLADLLMRAGSLSIEESVDYVMQACAGVGAAHARGIVHRDLKPSNLFLCQRDTGLSVKVLDFGISKVLGSETVEGRLTGTRSTLGSPFYMSPEQVRDPKAVDFRGDVWALGAILHELLSGTPAFDGESMSGVCAAIVTDPPAALRLKRPEVPPALEAVVLKCLEKDPARRFQSTLELRAALEAFITPKSEKRRALPTTPADTLNPSDVAGAPTVHLLPEGGNTLPSAVLRQSGAQNLPGRMQGPVVLIEPSPIAEASPVAQAGAKRARWPLALAGVLGLGLVATLWTTRDPLKPTTASAPAAARPFTLSIDSNPTGADVFEGPSQLGATPIQIAIDAASVSRGPRTFTLRMAGHVPYTLVQGASDESVRVVAALASVPAPAASKPAASAEHPASAAPSPPAHRPTPPARRPAAVSPSALPSSPDIRLQR